MEDIHSQSPLNQSVSQLDSCRKPLDLDLILTKSPNNKYYLAGWRFRCPPPRARFEDGRCGRRLVPRRERSMSSNLPLAYPTPDTNTSNSDEPALPKASQACLSCRRQKRRCDKKIPACSLCERMSRACDYSDASPAPTADDFNVLRQRILELEGRSLGSNGNVLAHGLPYQHTPASTISTTSGSVHQSPIPAYVLGPSYQPVQNRFPAIAFLDSEVFMHGRIEVPSPHIEIPLVSCPAPINYVLSPIFQGVCSFGELQAERFFI